MTAERVVSRLAAAAWAIALATVLDDERTVPDLVEGARPLEPAPSVTVVVPARDEARDVEDTLRRLVAQDHPGLEIVAIDDQSSDGTLAAMRVVAGIDVVEGSEPPAGWLGKSWACAQGVERAHGDWLLFLDADVKLEPGAVSAALAFALERGAAVATAFPQLVTGSFAERAVLPLAAAIMETAVIPSWLARRARTDVAIGVGGFLLLRRDLYESIGGHAAVRAEVVEDLALARRAKRAGSLVPWARGRRVMHLRFYHGAGEMWRGWRKNASQAWQAPLPVGVAGGALLTGIVLAPWVATARGRPSGMIGLALQALTLRRVAGSTDVPAPYAFSGPAGIVFLSAVGLASTWDRASGRGPIWRGRRVAV